MNKTNFERLYNGLVKENPTFVLMLGMCPTLAVTTSAINGMGMGLTTAVVLALSNVIISLMRKIIPAKVRIPAFIVIIASFVTIVQLLLEAYLPSLNEALGVYIPLIVVNCIILGRAEAYAYSNPPLPSLFDGIGMGLGFTVALTLIGAVREVLGAAKIFGIAIPGMVPIGIFVLAPGAFFVLAVLTAIQNFIKIQGEKHGKDMSKIQSGCNEDCMNCADSGCSKRFYDADAAGEDVKVQAKEVTEKPKAKKVKPDKAAEDVEIIDLDAEDAPAEEGQQEEVKPKRKPRKKKLDVVAEETVVAEASAAEETPEKPAVEDLAIEQAQSEEVKPKRKPRKKKAETVAEEVAEQVVADEAAEMPVEENPATEQLQPEEPATEEAKPKRKPRKKKAEVTAVVAEETAAKIPAEQADETQGKEDN